MWLGALLSVIAMPVMAAGGFSADQTEFLNSVTESYTSWQSVELNGKLHMDRLPVSPGLKIYMERGQSIYISVRAPFLGEIGRLELHESGLTAVNKLKKVYVSEDLSRLKDKIPAMAIENIQDLLIARAFIAGHGTLSPANQNLCSLYNEQDCWLLVPLVQPEGGSVRYGYTFDFSGKLQDLYVTTVSGNYAALAEYSYNGKKTLIDFNLTLRDKSYEARLQFDAPKWNPSRSLTPISINKDWRQVDIPTFLRSFHS